MFTLLDLQEVCCSEEKARKYAEKHGLLLKRETKYPKCDGQVAAESSDPPGKGALAMQEEGLPEVDTMY